MIDRIIGFIHMILSFIASIYFLWRNDDYDIYYIIYFCIVNISWVFMKNECIISYIAKKIHNNDYNLGDNLDIEDYDSIIGKEISNIFLNYVLLMYIVNLLVIVYVSDIKTVLKVSLLGVLFSYTSYILSIRKEIKDRSFYNILNVITNSTPLFIIFGLK
jgi:hypothetical protein